MCYFNSIEKNINEIVPVLEFVDYDDSICENCGGLCELVENIFWVCGNCDD
jgi:hypothetical protein